MCFLGEEMRAKLFLWGCVYFIFVVYGSLVPLEIKVITLDEAISRYFLIPYLDLNSFARADWVANILLYIPLAFMLSGSVCSSRNKFLDFIAIVFVLIFCISVAHAVEFTQLFFPKRTVSQNDLIAETIGSCLGVGFWLLFGQKLTAMIHTVNLGGFEFLRQSLMLYSFSYLFLAFFPFDFVLTMDELTDKINGNSNGIEKCLDNFLRCSVSSAAEVVTVIPIGIQIALFVKYAPHRIFTSIMIGLICGSIIEIVQLFLISGVSSFLSVVYKTIGLYFGVIIYSNANTLKGFSNFNKAKLIVFLLIPYILVVAGINGWFTQEWLTFDKGISTINDIQFLPFSYHYNVTEMMAMVSLLATSGMYGVIGLGYAILPNKDNKWLAGFYAALFCFIVESGKLFMVYKHPDPTNIMIAFFAAVFCFWYLKSIGKWFVGHYFHK